MGSLGQEENDDDIEAKESRTYTNEGIFPEASTEDNASADQKSYTFINTDRLGHSIMKGKRDTDTVILMLLKS